MKKNTILILTFAGLVALAGCTDPTQPIASEAISRGVAGDDRVVEDLSTIAKQYAVDKGVASARAVAASGKGDEAQGAVESTANAFETVGWLQIQHERNRALIRVGQTYVYSQKGIANILVDEAKQAKKNADAAKAAKDSPAKPNNPGGGALGMSPLPKE